MGNELNAIEELDGAVEAAAPADSPKPKRKKKKLVVLGTIVGVVAVLAVGFLVWHHQPSFCATFCHNTMGSYLESYENSDYLVHAHAEAGLVCLDCHPPVIADMVHEAIIQIKGTYRLPLAKMDVDDDFCLRDGCHTREDIVAALDDYTVEDGSHVNPHEVLFSATYSSTESPHTVSGAETLACKTCHTSHRASKGIEYCYTCHHARVLDKCSNCHDHR